jgi:NMD protein affecting ribosome stability and mRNA decay
MSAKNISHQPAPIDRHDRLLQEYEHDPYHARLKLKEPSICSDCGAVFQRGRWQWGNAPLGAHQVLCPACARTRDEMPAAYLTMRGAYIRKHLDEIMHLVRNHTQRERGEHPLKRIMHIEESDTGTILSFTEARLARDIGEALHHAYKGDLEYHYADEDVLLRVNWIRES